MDRFGAKATKAKQAQSRLKQIERIEVEELKTSPRRTPLFRFTPERASGRDVLEVASVSKAYGPKEVLRDVSLTVRRGEKVAVIGPNGLGKSTLLKIVMDRLPADRGTVRFGHEVRAGYFAQDHNELLQNGKMTPLDYLWEACPQEGTSYVRGQLGRVLFSGQDVEKPVGALSGGEAARLIFGRIIVEKPNVLVLDEPTNHLDLEAIHALVEGLKAFEGTVLFVSHDRWFVSSLATRILEVTPEGPARLPRHVRGVPVERCGDDHLDADAVVLKTKDARIRTRPSRAPRAASRGKSRSAGATDRMLFPARRDKGACRLSIRRRRASARSPPALRRAGLLPAHAWRSRLNRSNAKTPSSLSQIERWLAEWEGIEKELAT